MALFNNFLFVLPNIFDMNNVLNTYNKNNVVCAIIIDGTPLHHHNDKNLDKILGKTNKKLLNTAMMEMTKNVFPSFFTDGHKDEFSPFTAGTNLKRAYE